MKSFRAAVIPIVFMMFPVSTNASRPAGFFLPDSVREMTLQYRAVKDLIVLPVNINDSVQVNLILDTGCRNLVLFGKTFKKMFKFSDGKPIVFSGLGSGPAVTGRLSIGNRVSIGEVVGDQIPVVVVAGSNLFGNYKNVDGIIGYDIFLKFEIELDARLNTITFRPASRSSAPAGYTRVPLQIIDSRPIMKSEIIIGKDTPKHLDLMIDTGSSLGLLLKTTNISAFDYSRNPTVLGIGLNGPVSGFKTISKKLILDGFELERLATGIVSSEWHNNASIGMDVLKDYILVLNYCKAYACFKRNDA